jgi:hypothetical protein
MTGLPDMGKIGGGRGGSTSCAGREFRARRRAA